MSEKRCIIEDLIVENLQLTNLLLAKIYLTNISNNPNVNYIDKEDIIKEINSITDKLDKCGVELDE